MFINNVAEKANISTDDTAKTDRLTCYPEEEECWECIWGEMYLYSANKHFLQHLLFERSAELTEPVTVFLILFLYIRLEISTSEVQSKEDKKAHKQIWHQLDVSFMVESSPGQASAAIC